MVNSGLSNPPDPAEPIQVRVFIAINGGYIRKSQGKSRMSVGPTKKIQGGLDPGLLPPVALGKAFSGRPPLAFTKALTALKRALAIGGSIQKLQTYPLLFALKSLAVILFMMFS